MSKDKGSLWPLRIVQAKLGHGDEAICVARKPHKTRED